MTNEYDENLQFLYALQRLVQGVNSVYEGVPESIPTANLPLFVTFEQEGTEDYDSLGDEYLIEAVDYHMTLFIGVGALSANGSAIKKCRPFITRVREVFAPRRGAETSSQSEVVYRATYRGFRGPMEIEYPANSGHVYTGVIFRERLERLYRQNYNF